MFRLFPINDQNMSKRLAEINLQLKRKRSVCKMHCPGFFHLCSSAKSGQDCRMTCLYMAVTVPTYCSQTAKIFAPKCYNYFMKSIGVLVENSEGQFTIKSSSFKLQTSLWKRRTGSLLSEGP